jgi:hypothetical protein
MNKIEYSQFEDFLLFSIDEILKDNHITNDALRYILNEFYIKIYSNEKIEPSDLLPLFNLFKVVISNNEHEYRCNYKIQSDLKHQREKIKQENKNE